MIKTLAQNETPRKYHRCTVNDEFGHYHNRIHLSDSPCYIHLAWRENREAKIYSVGYYKLDLPALLAEGYIRKDDTGYVRVRFVHEDNGEISLRVRSDSSPLFIGTLLHRKEIYRSIVRCAFQEVARDTPSTEDLRDSQRLNSSRAMQSFPVFPVFFSWHSFLRRMTRNPNLAPAFPDCPTFSSVKANSVCSVPTLSIPPISAMTNDSKP